MHGSPPYILPSSPSGRLTVSREHMCLSYHCAINPSVALSRYTVGPGRAVPRIVETWPSAGARCDPQHTMAVTPTLDALLWGHGLHSNTSMCSMYQHRYQLWPSQGQHGHLCGSRMGGGWVQAISTPQHLTSPVLGQLGEGSVSIWDGKECEDMW